MKPDDEISPYERLLPARAVADRYGVHLRSISRWVSLDVIPPPDQTINARRYWYAETLDQADRRRTVAAGTKGHPPNISPTP
jgi:hypothetical protein